MTSVSSDTEACLDLPHLDGLVPATAEDVVPGGEEADAAHVVVVAVHCLDTLEGVEVPQLDGHVRAAGGKHLPILVQSHVLRETVISQRSHQFNCQDWI